MAPRDPFRAAGWYGWGIVAVLLILIPTACQLSQAAHGPAPTGAMFSPEACKQLAELVAIAAQARDGGIRQARFVEALEAELKKREAPALAQRIVLREIRRVYTSGQPGAVLELDVHTRCVSGPMFDAEGI